MSRRLKAGRFDRLGRLKTAVRARLDQVSKVDVETGLPKNNHEVALGRASTVDRRTGLPKDPA